jgi:hypothetical protein
MCWYKNNFKIYYFNIFLNIKYFKNNYNHTYKHYIQLNDSVTDTDFLVQTHFPDHQITSEQDEDQAQSQSILLYIFPTA